MCDMEISAEEYAELKGRPTKDELAAAEKKATEAEEAAATARKAAEDAEVAQKKAETERDEKAEALKKLEEEQSETKLRDERFEGLGDGFLAKLGDTTKANLREDAAKMDEDAWGKRLTELEELSGVKRDVKLDPKKGGGKPDPAKKPGEGDPPADEFSVEEIAESVAGGGEEESGLATGGQRASIARGLVGTPSKD
jgi:hypothetical protein